MVDKELRSSIPQNLIDWLLESHTPSIHYLTYKNILNYSGSNQSVSDSHADIVNSEYVKAILAEQNPEGFWYNARHYYGPKYRSSHWSMLLLSELGVPPEMNALQRGSEFMIRRIENDQNVYYSIASYQNKNQSGFCCFWGNWLRYQIYCGKIHHPTVNKVIKIVSEDIKRKSSCEYNDHLPCAWGVIRSLYGLALIPEAERSENIQCAIQQGITFVLNEFSLIKANYPNTGKIHPIWFKLSFPLYYQTDILFTLRVLAELKALNHPGAQEAIGWLESKRKQDGTWRGGSPFRNRSHPFLTEPDSVNRWITMHALSVLSAADKQARE